MPYSPSVVSCPSRASTSCSQAWRSRADLPAVKPCNFDFQAAPRFRSVAKWADIELDGSSLTTVPVAPLKYIERLKADDRHTVVVSEFDTTTGWSGSPQQTASAQGRVPFRRTPLIDVQYHSRTRTTPKGSAWVRSRLMQRSASSWLRGRARTRLLSLASIAKTRRRGDRHPSSGPLESRLDAFSSPNSTW